MNKYIYIYLYINCLLPQRIGSQYFCHLHHPYKYLDNINNSFISNTTRNTNTIRMNQCN